MFEWFKRLFAGKEAPPLPLPPTAMVVTKSMVNSKYNIAAMHKSGMTVQAIMKRTGMPHWRVANILRAQGFDIPYIRRPLRMKKIPAVQSRVPKANPVKIMRPDPGPHFSQELAYEILTGHLAGLTPENISYILGEDETDIMKVLETAGHPSVSLMRNAASKIRAAKIVRYQKANPDLYMRDIAKVFRTDLGVVREAFLGAGIPLPRRGHKTMEQMLARNKALGR